MKLKLYATGLTFFKYLKVFHLKPQVEV